MRSVRIATLAGCLLAAGCGTVISLEAEAPDACVTITGLHVPGADDSAGQGAAGTVTTLTQDFAVPLDSSSLPSGARISLVSFTLVPEGAGSFGFVTSGQLSAKAGGSAKPLAQYTPSSAASSELVMAPSSPVDVTSDLSNRTLDLEGELTGPMPAKGFSAHAVACFDVTAQAVAL